MDAALSRTAWICLRRGIPFLRQAHDMDLDGGSRGRLAGSFIARLGFGSSQKEPDARDLGALRVHA